MRTFTDTRQKMLGQTIENTPQERARATRVVMDTLGPDALEILDMLGLAE